MAELYTRLLEWRRAEAATRGLGKVPNDVYAQIAAYIVETRHTLETEVKDNPAGRRSDLARQTHQKSIQTARDLFDARANKILVAAFQATIGGSRDLPNATPEERKLHEELLTSLRQFRRVAAPFLEPEGPGAAPPAAANASAGATSRESAPPPPSPAPPREATPRAKALAETLAYVRILRSGPPIAIGSETVELRAEDVLQLPVDIARALVDGKIAERIDTSNAR
jgi:DNA replication initiation complex subunit (GINS family)